MWILALIIIINISYLVFWLNRRKLTQHHLQKINKLLGKKDDENVHKKSIINQSASFLDKKLKKTDIGQEIYQKIEEKKLPNDITPGNLILINIVLFFISTLVSDVFQSKPLHLFVTLIFLESIYVIYIWCNNKIRLELEEKMPQLLDLIARIYRVQPNLKDALIQTEKNIDSPSIKQILTEIINLSNLGYTTIEAMQVKAHEIHSQDFNFVISSIKLNEPLGGNLSDLLENTAEMIRKKRGTKQEIKAIMMQNKISAIIISIIAPVAFIFSYTFSNNYKKIIHHNPAIQALMLFALIWWIIGVMIVIKNLRQRV